MLFGLSLSFRDAPPNSGLPEFGNIIVQVAAELDAQARNDGILQIAASLKPK
jgi:hypothetical protein